MTEYDNWEDNVPDTPSQEPPDKLSERWKRLFAGAHPKSIVGEFPHPEWGDEIAALEQRMKSLVEDLESAYSDRGQLLGAIQYGVDRLPETSGNIPVRAQLEMALTDLIIAEEETHD